MMGVNWDTAAGDTLRARRLAAGLSQRALAVRAGVGQTTVARIESHRTQPTLPVLGKLLDALDTELVPVEIQPGEGVAVAAAREVSVLLAGSEPSLAVLGECLRATAGIVDELQRSTPQAFRRSVAPPPPATGVPGFDALIAGLVEDSSEKAGVAPPAWVEDGWRFVGEWVISGAPELRERALRESPPALRRHGVYVLPGEFSRA